MPEYNLSKYYGQPEKQDEPETPSYDLSSYYEPEEQETPSFLDD